MTILFDRVWDIVSENRLAYIILNCAFYGLMTVLMVYSLFDAPFQKAVVATNGAYYMSGPLAYSQKTAVDMEVVSGLGSHFLVLLMVPAYGEITMPSFLIPFAGIVTGLFHAAMWGIVYGPSNPAMTSLLLPHSMTILLEGQAYVLSMLGAYIQGRAMLWPATFKKASRWQAYVEGVRQNGTLYMLVIPLLFISALYGVIEVGILSSLH